MKITLKVTDDGQLLPIESDKAKFSRYKAKLHSGTMVEMEINRIRAIRSEFQNNYYWGAIVTPLADELGYSTDDMHEVLKYLHNPKILKLPDGKEIQEGATTTSLDTFEAEKYFESIRVWAKLSLNFTIELPL